MDSLRPDRQPATPKPNDLGGAGRDAPRKREGSGRHRKTVHSPWANAANIASRVRLWATQIAQRRLFLNPFPADTRGRVPMPATQSDVHGAISQKFKLKPSANSKHHASPSACSDRRRDVKITGASERSEKRATSQHREPRPRRMADDGA